MNDDFDNSIYEKLVKMIKNEKYATSDRVGNTPLITFAQKMKNLGPNTSEKESFKWALGKVLQNINEFDHEQIFLIANLLYISQIMNEMKIDGFRNDLLSAWRSLKEDKVAERAELMRFISKYTAYKFTKNALNKEILIKERLPWHWIDLAVDAKLWELAFNNVKAALAEKNANIMQLLARIRSWHTSREGELKTDIEKYISPYLDEDDFEKLQKWYYKISGIHIDSPREREFFKNVNIFSHKIFPTHERSLQVGHP
ncbi:MAG TPA: hypothetical protein VMU29_04670 [Smithella sp.]|nr:hypothetical protein [Smithella sp.]